MLHHPRCSTLCHGMYWRILSHMLHHPRCLNSMSWNVLAHIESYVASSSLFKLFSIIITPCEFIVLSAAMCYCIYMNN